MERHLYLHYKGGVYEKLGHGTHTETGEKTVIYKDGDGKLWVRPFDMFYGQVLVNDEPVQRFKFLGRF